MSRCTRPQCVRNRARILAQQEDIRRLEAKWDETSLALRRALELNHTLEQEADAAGMAKCTAEQRLNVLAEDLFTERQRRAVDVHVLQAVPNLRERMHKIRQELARGESNASFVTLWELARNQGDEG